MSFSSVRIATLIAVPMLSIVLSGIITFQGLVSANQTRDLARDRYELALSSARVLAVLDSGLESLLVSADLVVGLEQWLAAPALLSQISALR